MERTRRRGTRGVFLAKSDRQRRFLNEAPHGTVHRAFRMGDRGGCRTRHVVAADCRRGVLTLGPAFFNIRSPGHAPWRDRGGAGSAAGSTSRRFVRPVRAATGGTKRQGNPKAPCQRRAGYATAAAHGSCRRSLFRRFSGMGAASAGIRAFHVAPNGNPGNLDLRSRPPGVFRPLHRCAVSLPLPGGKAGGDQVRHARRPVPSQFAASRLDDRGLFEPSGLADIDEWRERL